MLFQPAHEKPTKKQEIRLQRILNSFREGLRRAGSHENKVQYLHKWKHSVPSLSGELSPYEMHHLKRFINIIDALIEHHSNNIIQGETNSGE